MMSKRRMLFRNLRIGVCVALVALAAWFLVIGPKTVGFNVWVLRTTLVSDSMKREAVGRLVGRGSMATTSLIAALDQESSSSPNPLILETLGGIKDHSAVPPLLRLLNSAQTHADLVVWAVGRCGREEDAGSLIHSLRHENPAVRAKTVAAISELAPKRSFNVILDCLQDPEGHVRSEARCCLERAFGIPFEANTTVSNAVRIPDSDEIRSWENEYRLALAKTKDWWKSESMKYPAQLEVSPATSDK